MRCTNGDIMRNFPENTKKHSAESTGRVFGSQGDRILVSKECTQYFSNI